MDLWLLIFEASIWLFGMMRKKAISVADNNGLKFLIKRLFGNYFFLFSQIFQLQGNELNRFKSSKLLQPI